ncbi:MAG: LPXTG cell wall anchor domain-containing protein [Limosilactobacillus coleohominis]|nr:LPXTG cell wall anchor domain-containing protein [Limosilactobacillus coleohominis]MDY3702278.1 LPXTG cell wall anchor domain-containing protein [Limosilactobacillus coleohominis]
MPTVPDSPKKVNWGNDGNDSRPVAKQHNYFYSTITVVDPTTGKSTDYPTQTLDFASDPNKEVEVNVHFNDVVLPSYPGYTPKVAITANYHSDTPMATLEDTTGGLILHLPTPVEKYFDYNYTITYVKDQSEHTHATTKYDFYSIVTVVDPDGKSTDISRQHLVFEYQDNPTNPEVNVHFNDVNIPIYDGYTPIVEITAPDDESNTPKATLEKTSNGWVLHLPTPVLGSPNYDYTVIMTKHDTGTPAQDNKDVLNIVKYVDGDGNVIKTQSATGKDGDPIDVEIPEGYHVDGGNTPALTIDSHNPVHQVTVVKDQHDTDTPENNNKDVLNIVKYVDGDGNVIKTQPATGKDGDAIDVEIPDGYHVDGGNTPSLVIDSHNPVHQVTVVKDQHDTDNPIVKPELPSYDVNKINNHDNGNQGNNGNNGISNNKRVNDSSQVVANDTQNSGNGNQKLPQTGNTQNNDAVIGLGLVSLLSMIGLAGLTKKEN